MRRSRAVQLMLLASLAVAGGTPAGCARTSGVARPPQERARFAAMFARGYVPGRSGQLFIVADPGSYLIEQDEFHHYMHGTPWPCDTRIPLLFYGPGFVRPGVLDSSASLQDVAPTLLALVNKPVPDSMTGRPLIRWGERSKPPRLVVLMVLDGMGRATWDRYVDTLHVLPTLARLRDGGAWFPKTEIDYLPTVTAVGHATVSTGTDPRFHGIPGNAIWVSGAQQDPFKGMSPERLRTPTLADYWLRDKGAVVIAQGTSTRATVTLAGHGGRTADGREVAVAMLDETVPGWKQNEACYRRPAYLSADTTQKFRARYGTTDPRWNAFLRSRWLPALQCDALLEIIRRERVGRDEIPDLMLVNWKTPDYVSHEYGPRSDSVRVALQELDLQLGRLLDTLDVVAGRDRYVVAITADHGMPTDTSAVARLPGPPGTTFDLKGLAAALRTQFPKDSAAVLAFHDASSNQLYVDTTRLGSPQLTLHAMAKYLEGLPGVLYTFPEDEIDRVRMTLPSPGRR